MDDDLYQEIILDHYRNPRNRGPCPDCTQSVHHDNPLCGDELTLSLRLDDQRIVAITFEGQGCAISMASASMMTEGVKGLDSQAALEQVEAIRRLMHGEPIQAPQSDLEALEGLKRYPVRIKCALLPWMALKDALTQASPARAPRAPGKDKPLPAPGAQPPPRA